MFEARLSQGALLKRVFEAVKELCTDVNIEVNEKGLELQAMDNSHVSLVILDFKKAAFDFYRCDSERSIGLNMETVVKVMRMCGNDDSVTLRHQDDSDQMEFCFENEQERKTSSFKMKLMVIEDERMGVPEIDFDTEVYMSTKVYTSTIGQLSQFSDMLKISITKGSTIEISAAGDSGDATITYSPNDGDTDVRIASTSDTKATFGTRYLQLFCKAAPVSDHLTLKISHKQPLLVIFDLNGDSSVGTLTFFLAPKMDESAIEED